MQVSAFGGDEQSDTGDHWKYVSLLPSLSEFIHTARVPHLMFLGV
jgi:hypothetical protein